MNPPRRPLAPAPPASVVAERLDEVRRRMGATGRPVDEVRVVAVTKGFDATAVTAALGAGLNDIGENYADELVSKAAVLEADADAPGRTAAGDAGDAPVVVRWHYLGAVQRRRVRDLAPVVGCWQTLARLVEGEEVARRAPGAAVLVEVETTGGPGRNGCPPGDVPGLVRSLRACDLDVRGLMVVAPAGPPAEARSAFRTTAALAAELGLGELSMGMSEDLEVAVEEGATMVRLGRALFGPRPAVDRAR